ncbi:MAG: M20/M25/M40 family metallo-hydrolase [Holophagaceae bacterium]|nr:M20/M25/M40 family metallo-hydrolase [Holophagaceae bacterium]
MSFPIRSSLSGLFALAVVVVAGGCGGGEPGLHPASQPPVLVDFTPASPRLGKQALVDDLRVLSAPDMEGRKLGSAGNAKARAMIVGRFQQLGLSSYGGGFEQPATWRNTPCTNVVGYWPGATNPGRAILFTAHYDHIGIRNGEINTGADDNASGSAALLQLAAWLKDHPPAHTVVFCLFDGEEAGLYGSQAFVAAPPAALPLAAIDVVLNLDMIAQGTKGRIFVGGTSYTTALKPHLAAAFSASAVRLVPDFETYDNASDQFPFMQRGIPFLFFCVGDDDPYYHTPRDTFESIPQVFYWAAVEAILDTFLRLDGLPNIPLILPRPPVREPGAEQRALDPHPWRHRRIQGEE